jgi:hypothetical protein
MYAKVQFKPNDKSNRFDFTFDSYSKEPPRGAVLTNAAPGATPSAATPATATPAPAAAAGTAATATAAAPTSAPATPATLMPNSGGGIDPALVPTAIPDTVPEMVKELRTRTDQIRGLIEKGSFGSIYVPAFQAKDIALALDEHKGDLPAEKQKVVDPAIAKLVRSAYMLDAFGDLGNKEQITEAYAMFLAASKDITGAFPTQP